MQRKDIFDLTDKLTIFRESFRKNVTELKKEYEGIKSLILFF